LNKAGHWAEISDASNYLVYVTDDLRRTYSGRSGLAPVPIGLYPWGSEALSIRLSWTGLGTSTIELWRETFKARFVRLLATTPGGRDELRELVDPAFRDLVDELPDGEMVPVRSVQMAMAQVWGIDLGTWATSFDVRDASGRLAGSVVLLKPAAGMAILGPVTSISDVRHFERTQQVTTAARRPAAILSADLEASSALARRLSTADYFTLARRLVRAADHCLLDAGGLVGRHLGDGVMAFFLAEILGSESEAAKAAIEATRALRMAAPNIAERSGLAPDEVVLRFGLHWGATLYVGLIKTLARSEVTALGDEVNEAARIEACASGGRALASKSLVERLDPEDARTLDLEHVTYTPLGELPTATEKARRDAPAIAVCEM
jgi:class 3 adenylate cyclase